MRIIGDRCKRNHVLTAKNSRLVLRSDGRPRYRRCLSCQALRQRGYEHAKRLANLSCGGEHKKVNDSDDSGS